MIKAMINTIINTMKPQFEGVKNAAANISGGGRGDYTAAMFQADFPQFYTKATAEETMALLPAAMLEMFIAEANGIIDCERWGTSWRYAAGLYVAHQAALYLRSFAPGSDTPKQAAQSGEVVGVVKSAKLGDASVTYDTEALTAATAKWGDLNATVYGQMLATRARLAGLGGSYVI